MKEKQGVNRGRRCGLSEPEAESRRKLVDWMCEVGDTIKLTSECIHKAVAYMDVILSQNTVADEHVQAVSIICMLIAGKLVEKDSAIERVAALFKRKMANPRVEIMKYEVQILSLLHWDMQCVTPIEFVKFFVSQGIVFSSDLPQPGIPPEQLARSARQYAEFFADLCLQESGMQQIDSLHLAGAIIAASRRSLRLPAIWPRELELLTTLPYPEIECHLNVITRYTLDTIRHRHYEKLFPQAQAQPTIRTRALERSKENMAPRTARPGTVCKNYPCYDPGVASKLRYI